MGPGKSKRSVWGAGPSMVVPILAGAAQGAAQGAQPSFPAGIFPLWEHPGVPSLSHRLRTPCAWAPRGRDTALALQI